MKNKREITITLLLLILGMSLAYFIFQKSILNSIRDIFQPSKILIEQSASKPSTINPTLEAAVEIIKQKGYTVFDASRTWYNSSLSDPLNVLIGTCTGSADGYCNQAFFFYNGKYLGTDTSDPSIGIELVWKDSETVALYYRLYRKDDSLCCPTVGAALVRFKWDGSKLKALDPIPTSDWFADIHR